jgi:transcriptional regulator with XRE-family HTH domain
MTRRFKRTYPNLVAYFEQSGETQAAFAARVHKSQSWVSRVRSGEVEPNLTDALMICREAGVPLESLIRRQQALSGT